MNLQGNWIDLILLIFIALYSYQGMGRGFLLLTAEMLSFILSFAISLHYYSFASIFLSSNFSLNHNLANVLGFISIAIISQVTISRLFNKLFKLFPQNAFNSPLNHFFGLLPAAIDGLILSAFILTVTIALPLSPSLKSDILSSKIGSKLVSHTSSIEGSLDKIFGPTLQNSLSFLTIKSGSTQNINLHFKTSDFTTDTNSEKLMLQLLNKERQSRHLSLLSLDLELQSLARAHSKDMFSNGYFSHIDQVGHDPFDRMKALNISYQIAGENLAYAPTVQIAHDGLMNSPGHRANILNSDFGKVGIGIIDAGVYGKMITQEFTD